MFMLGDAVERLLRSVGMTKERVQAITGNADCGCARRQEQANNFGLLIQRYAINILYRVLNAIAVLRHMFRKSRFGRASVYLKMAAFLLVTGREYRQSRRWPK